jgi:hypothetical protein
MIKDQYFNPIIMPKELRTAILINRNNKKYKFIYLTFRDDGSIFLTYPRKNGYRVASDTNIATTPMIQEEKIYIKRENIKHYDPKISFHPGKQSIHLNSHPKRIFKTDKQILQMGENGSVFPICQILIPFGANYLDKYSPKKKYFKPLEIRLPHTDATLSLLIWGHDSMLNLALEDLPHVDKLKEVSTTIISRRFVHPFLDSFTCSVFIHDLGIREKVTERQSNSIITTIYNKSEPYIFELIPKEDHYSSSTHIKKDAINSILSNTMR